MRRRLGWAALATVGLTSMVLGGCASSGGSDSADNTDTVCQVASAGFAALVGKLSHDEDIEGVLDILDRGHVLDATCQSLVRQWRSNPSAQITFEIDQHGTSTVQKLLGTDVLPASRPPVDFPHLLRCEQYWSGYPALVDLCDQGVLSTP